MSFDQNPTSLIYCYWCEVIQFPGISEKISYQESDTDNRNPKRKRIVVEMEGNEPPKRHKNDKTKIEKYNNKDHGPFVLVAEKTDKTPINDMLVARELNQLSLLHKMVTNIKNLTPNKIKITCENSQSANKIITAAHDKKIKLNIFIPETHLYCEGVVTGVPTEIEIQEIADNVQSNCHITEVTRIERWDLQSQKLVPTTAIRIKFRQYNLPEKVTILCINFKVKPFIKAPLFCKICKSFGHTKKWCKNINTCGKCFLQHAQSECSTPTRTCRYCPATETHHTGDRICPETINQRQIAEVMARQRISFRDAKLKLFPNYNIEAPSITNHTNFPRLPTEAAITNMEPAQQGKTTTLSNRIKELQDPTSTANKIINLHEQLNNYKTFINEIILMLSKEKKDNAIIKGIIETAEILKTAGILNTNTDEKKIENSMEVETNT